MGTKHSSQPYQVQSLFTYRIHTIPSVPIVDCFQKIRQQVKCYLQMAGTMRKQELQEVSLRATYIDILCFKYGFGLNCWS